MHSPKWIAQRGCNYQLIAKGVRLGRVPRTAAIHHHDSDCGRERENEPPMHQPHLILNRYRVAINLSLPKLKMFCSDNNWQASQVEVFAAWVAQLDSARETLYCNMEQLWENEQQVRRTDWRTVCHGQRQIERTFSRRSTFLGGETVRALGTWHLSACAHLIGIKVISNCWSIWSNATPCLLVGNYRKCLWLKQYQWGRRKQVNAREGFKLNHLMISVDYVNLAFN